MPFQDTYADTTTLLESREKTLSRIDPASTPVFDDAEIESGVTAVSHSWDEDDVTPPVGINKAVQTADYTYTTIAPTKGTNYTQLLTIADKVSYTNQAVDHPAVKDKVKDKAMYLMKKIKLDAENSMINGTKTIGSGAVAAEMGGLKAFAGAGTTVTNGAAVALSLDLFVAFQKKGWDLGAQWDRVLVNGNQKSGILDKSTVPNYQRNTTKMDTLKTNWDIIETTYGTIEVIPHRTQFVANGELIAYTKDFVKKGVIQSFQRDMKVAPTGTAIPVAIFGEYTLIVKNAKAVGKTSNYTL